MDYGDNKYINRPINNEPYEYGKLKDYGVHQKPIRWWEILAAFVVWVLVTLIFCVLLNVIGIDLSGPITHGNTAAIVFVIVVECVGIWLTFFAPVVVKLWYHHEARLKLWLVRGPLFGMLVYLPLWLFFFHSSVPLTSGFPR
jgi:hypothetical protein